jgi:alpha-tubulin suppressor-like RCC1 family protein
VMKKRMVALAMMIALLAISSPALVACQTEEWVEETSVGPETFTALTAWGGNSSGQLGDGTFVARRTTPVEVSNLDGAELKAITGGAYHSLALKEDGTVLAWGDNQYGQLGDGTNTSSSTPVQVQDPNDPSGYLSAVETIAAGSFHSLALKDDGTVWAWGSNRVNELGDETIDNSAQPVQVGNLSEVEAIAAGSSHNLALKSDGTVWAWGNNTNGRESPLFGSISGQLGDNELPRSSTPVQVGGLPDGIEAVAAGLAYSLALKDDGTVWAWGFNDVGQLGDGTSTDTSTPVRVSGLDGVRAIAAGGSNGLALNDDGTVWAWGFNRFGQLGDGTSTDGTVTTCELTGGGAMGNSSCTDSNTPVQASELNGIEAIAAGSSHGLALKDDGTVWAWGFNQNGQLGNGSYTLGTPTQGINIPMPVGELSAVKAIAAGGDHSLAGW